MQNNTVYYAKILKQNNDTINYFSTTKKFLQRKEFKTPLGVKTFNVIFPVLINWTVWILKEAEKINIKKLYFLARDGKIIYQIAQSIIQKYNLDITCHYLYCSRKSLRTGLYCLDQELALEKICLNSFEITPDILMERAGIKPTLRDEVLINLGINKKDHGKMLSRNELMKLKRILRTNPFFREIILKESNEAYSLTIDYLDQEGLFDDTVLYGIVDSGWVGSMQQILCKYIRSKNPRIQIIHGFYFGIFGNRNDIHNKYHAFHFSGISGINHFIFFNNNLFECICAADHGMTLRYEKENDRVIPVCKEYSETSPYIQFHFNYIKEFVFSLTMNWNSISSKKLKEMTYYLLKHLMSNPDFIEINIYGSIQFCDDSTEQYFYPLAPKYTTEQMKGYSIPMKLWNFFINRNKFCSDVKSFWPWATISQLEKGKCYYRINYYIWSFLLWCKYTKN